MMLYFDEDGTAQKVDEENTVLVDEKALEDFINKFNEQKETLEKIKKKSKEFKEHIQSEIRVAEYQIQNGEKKDKKHWIARQNAYEELLEEMPWLLVWEGEIE